MTVVHSFERNSSVGPPILTILTILANLVILTNLPNIPFRTVTESQVGRVRRTCKSSLVGDAKTQYAAGHNANVAAVGRPISPGWTSRPARVAIRPPA